MTATVISTNMSRRPCRAEAMARRNVVAPPAATASASRVTHHGRGAPSASAARPAARATALIASHGTREPDGAGRTSRDSSSGNARRPVSATASAIAPRDVTAAS